MYIVNDLGTKETRKLKISFPVLYLTTGLLKFIPLCNKTMLTLIQVGNDYVHLGKVYRLKVKNELLKSSSIFRFQPGEDWPL